ncbi:phospho-sugar mutase [uncultured Methanobrevibacter sp.]|uniref:phospho-sugar mutase n=1 Tax=uncultured Methanobrevibacter sp. TaxID=253161 RepID=UPI0025890F7E|nr:phospho-sugar mutase [uncultured Methanobrevibacter sp.]
MDQYLEKYNSWLEDPAIDDDTKNELKSIKNNEEEIKDRFYKDLEFGTAGLRGVIGSGTNRMNKYTVGKATQGLANYIVKNGLQDVGVVIAYDCRHMSKEFSRETAVCLNANGIKTYIFESLRPVPELSFSVRELKCAAGIMITASHNPPEYNGYKVYWNDGAQIVPPRDKEIISEVNNTKFSDIKTMDLDLAMSKGLYNVVGEEVDNKFINKLKSLVLNPDVIKEQADKIKIVYTPLHGTGGMLVKRLLNELGFKNVYIVKEQEEPNGDFPTVDYPNPEDKNAFKLALELAKKVDADIVLANDPDADRVGMYSKDDNGNYVPYTGNMASILLLEYELSQKKEKDLLPKNACVITTIVSTNMAKAVADYYGIAEFETLTGFKWIGKKIREFEENNNEYSFQFGFEESYGCIISPHARDKDGISAVMCACEACAYYKSKGLTLWQQMNNIYKKYGYYKEGQIAIVLKGADGAEQIKNKMTKMRNSTPSEIAGLKVMEFRDYQEHIIKKADGTTAKTDLPTSNVLYYDLEDNNWCCVRPSGTEPKIKFYMGVKGNSQEDANKKYEVLVDAIKKLAE